MTLPPLPSTVGKKGKLVEPLGGVERYVVVDEVRLQETDYPVNMNMLQLLEFEDGHKELRVCYYAIGQREGRTCGKWLWGQYAPMLPASDFEALVNMATEKGWIGKGELE